MNLPYTIFQLNEGPKISLSPRIDNLENKFIKIVPGPGAYSPGEKKQQNYSFSFGLKPSVDYPTKYLGGIPGPGTYDSRAIRTFSTMGASLDHGDKTQLLNKTQAIVPGPGQYQPTSAELIIKNDNPKYGFGTSIRADIGGRTGGNIHSKRNLSETGDSIATYNPLVPGPGAYDIKGVVGNDGPKRSLAGRFTIDLTAKELNFKPGPGAYTP